MSDVASAKALNDNCQFHRRWIGRQPPRRERDDGQVVAPPPDGKEPHINPAQNRDGARVDDVRHAAVAHQDHRRARLPAQNRGGKDQGGIQIAGLVAR